MSVRSEIRRERRQPIGLSLRELARPRWRDLALRFAFGAAIALAAGLLGMRFGHRLGGTFLAFPAILPAALTLLERSDGVAKTDIDAAGATLGALAMLIFALALALLAPRLGPLPAIAVAAAAWVASALALFAIGRRLLARLGM